MKPKKYPYSGKKGQEKPSYRYIPELIVFPNISFRKEMLRYLYTVIKNTGRTTNIYFRIPKPFSFDEKRITVNLSYEETIEVLKNIQ